MNHMNLKFSPVAVRVLSLIGVTGLALLLWLYSRFNFSVEIKPIASIEPAPQLAEPAPPVQSSPITPFPSPSSSPAPRPIAATEQLPAPAAKTALQGSIRVKNQTEYPIRVALLHQKVIRSTPVSPGANPLVYTEPVHWDFAPYEGSTRGLILSLPEGKLALREGDVIVAFAQDGSRRYWGPYVVGKTEAPIWERATSEWQLVLDP